jgi:hypothetical protein
MGWLKPPTSLYSPAIFPLIKKIDLPSGDGKNISKNYYKVVPPQ